MERQRKQGKFFNILKEALKIFEGPQTAQNYWKKHRVTHFLSFGVLIFPNWSYFPVNLKPKQFFFPKNKVIFFDFPAFPQKYESAWILEKSRILKFEKKYVNMWNLGPLVEEMPH